MDTRGETIVTTDLMRLEEMLESFGIEYDMMSYSDGVHVHLDNGYTKVGGIRGLRTIFEFDELGNFKTVGAW